MRFSPLVKERLLNEYYTLSIKNKISLSFTIVFSTLLILLVIIIYNVSSGILINKTIENTLQNLELVSEKLDITFDNVENYTRATITNKDIQEILSKADSKDELNKYNDYIKVRDTLDSIIQPRTLVESMVLYDFKKNMFDSGKIQNIEITFNSEYERYKTSPGQNQWVDTHESNYIVRENKQNVITLVRGFFNIESGVPLGILITNTNENYISGLYSKIKLGDSGKIFIINKEGIIVSHKDKNRIYNSVKTEPYFSLIDGLEGGKIFSLNKTEYLVVYRFYERLNWTIVGLVPTNEITKDNSILTNRVLLVFIVSILISIVFTMLLSNSITKPIIKLKQTMKQVGEGDLEARVELLSKDEVGALAEEFNRMIKKTSNLMESVVNEQKKKKEYELSLLQSQINPHFLYNTLESICGLAELNRNEDIINVVNELALFYRGVLSKGSRIITIRDEISITERYLKILKVRYGDQLDYCIDIDEDIYKYTTIKLLLQPLVENSIYHGLRNKRGKGIVEIKGLIENNKVVIKVIDNGIGIKPEVLDKLFTMHENDYKSKGFGLKSTDDRIKLYFGNEYGLEVFSVYGEGTTVKVILPTNEIWGGIE